MIQYSEDLPTLDQIKEAIIEKGYSLHPIVADGICQLCAGKAARYESEEVPEGEYICFCKVVRDDEERVRVWRKKLTNYHLSWDPDAPAPDIKIKGDYYVLRIRIWKRIVVENYIPRNRVDVYHIIHAPYPNPSKT